MIEVMLAVAIVSVLFVATMLTIQVSISRQRYDDAVQSFKDFLQRQYSEVQNVTLDSGVTNITMCDGASGVRGEHTRGRTDCYVVGRLLNFRFEPEPNGGGVTKVRTNQLLYYSQDTSANGSPNKGGFRFNDFILDNKDRDLRLAGNETFAIKEIEDYSLEWGARLKYPGETDYIRDATVLIFRSPDTGSIRTHLLKNYQTSVNTADMQRIFSNSTLDGQMDMCIKADFDPRGPWRSVRISAGSANASGVELPVPGNNAVEGQVNCD